MAFMEEVPTPGNNTARVLINPVTGMISVAGTPIQATEEQNQRVRMILQALQQGQAPMDAGVPNSTGLTPVGATSQFDPNVGIPNITPKSLIKEPFVLQGYQEPPGGLAGGPTPPSDNRSRLLDALRTRPQETIQAMSQLATQLKGVPEFAQKEVYQGLGIGQPQNAPLTDLSVQAAAAGQPIPGLSPDMARRIIEQKRASEVATDVAKKEAEATVKGTLPLGEKAKMYYNVYGDMAPATMTLKQAETQGYTLRTPEQMKAIPAARSVYFTTDHLRPLLDKLLVKVKKQEEMLPWYTRFMNIQKNRIAMDVLRKTGDPDVRQFDQFVQAGLVRYLIGLGIPGGRETVAMLNRMSVEFPDSGDSKEAAKAVLDNVDEMMYMVTGIQKRQGGSKAGTPPVPRIQDENGTWYIKMGDTWYIDPKQGSK